MENLVQIGKQSVHPIGIGTWNIGNHKKDEASEIAAIQAGIEAGAQVIDTAEMYADGGAEKRIGKAIQGYDRNQLYLISKVLPENASRRQLPRSLERSLDNLQVERLDLYLLHWKSSVPLQETVETLEEMRQSGKIKAWGVSNFDKADLQKLGQLEYGKNCMANQVKYNLIDRGLEYDLLPYMESQQLSFMAYSPIFKGNISRFSNQQITVLETLADRHRASIYQIMLAWVIRNGKTIAIPKTAHVQHMIDNIAAVNIDLNSEDCRALDTVFPAPTCKQKLALW